MTRPPASQIGQDVWVLEMALPGRRRGFFVDVGAFDGVQYSNTLALARMRGWRGICIEAVQDAAARLQVNRPEAVVVQAAVAGGLGERRFDGSRRMLSRFSTEAGGVVPTTPLADILDEANAPKILDYLSIDVEGAEVEILLPLLSAGQYCFRCATVEVSASGPERAALEEALGERGYEIVARFFSDWFIVHRGLLPDYRHPAGWFTETLLRRLPPAVWLKPEVAGVSWVETWKANRPCPRAS